MAKTKSGNGTAKKTTPKKKAVAVRKSPPRRTTQATRNNSPAKRKSPSGKRSPSGDTNESNEEEIERLRRENDELKSKVRELTQRLNRKEFNLRAVGFHLSKVRGGGERKWRGTKTDVALMKKTEQECTAVVDVMASWLHNVVWPEKNFCLRIGSGGARRGTPYANG